MEIIHWKSIFFVHKVLKKICQKWMFESWSFLCVCRLMYFPKIVIVLCLNSKSQNIPCPPLFSQLILKKKTKSDIIKYHFIKNNFESINKTAIAITKKSKFNRTTKKLAIKKHQKNSIREFRSKFCVQWEIEGRSENGKRWKFLV